MRCLSAETAPYSGHTWDQPEIWSDCRSPGAEPPTSPEHVRLEKLVAEFPVVVIRTGQVTKRRQFRIERYEFGPGRVQDLPPMRPRAERQQNLFDLGCRCRHRVGLSQPGKMDGDAVIPERRAEPQPVPGHAADLGRPQKAVDALADIAQPRDRRRRPSARDHVLALQMKGGIRLDIEPKMRQPLRPGASA